MRIVAFTLIELMVVVSVVGVLMALLLAAVRKVREGARQMSRPAKVAATTGILVTITSGGLVLFGGSGDVPPLARSQSLTRTIPPAPREIVAAGSLDVRVQSTGSDVRVEEATIELRFPSDGGAVRGTSRTVSRTEFTEVRCVTRRTTVEELTGTFLVTTASMRLASRGETGVEVLSGCEDLTFEAEVLQATGSASVDLGSGTVRGSFEGASTFEASFEPVTPETVAAPPSPSQTAAPEGGENALPWAGVAAGAALTVGSVIWGRRKPEDFAG